MATFTPKYNAEKPLTSEFYDVAKLNSNSDITDRSTTHRITAAGTGDAITGSVPNLQLYYDGLGLNFYITADNTGAVTININGLGAKAIIKIENSLSLPMVAGDFTTGNNVILVYDNAANSFIIAYSSDELLRVIKSRAVLGGGFFQNAGAEVKQAGVIDRWFNIQVANYAAQGIKRPNSLTNFSMRFTGSNDVHGIRQRLLSNLSTKLIGQVVTISGWLELDATAAAATAIIITESAPSVADDWASFTTNILHAFSQSLVVGWQYIEHSFTVPTTVGANSINNGYGLKFGVSGLSVIANMKLSEPKLELGATATAYIPNTVADELAACQPFYLKSYSQGVDPGTVTRLGAITEFATRNAANSASGTRFVTEMRTVPIITLYSPQGGGSGVLRNGIDRVAAANDIGSGGFRSISITGGTTGDLAEYHYTANARLE